MTDFTKNIVSKKVIALCKAAAKVRGGSWINGAPTHIFPEFLAELEKDGWKLIQPNPPRIPYSTTGNIDEAEAYEE